MVKTLSNEDLTHIIKNSMRALETLKNARLFITGGTGFFGKWLVESLLYANEKLSLHLNITILTRNPEYFLQHMPHLKNHPYLFFVKGDVRNFSLENMLFTHIIHAATDASQTLNTENPIEMWDVIVNGTKQTFDFARNCKAQNILLISSGAVYGKQPPELSHISEDFLGSPDIHKPSSAYGMGKRTAEHLATLYHYQHGLNIKIARCFAFVGPHLPLTTHFAIGNFIQNVLEKKPIVVNGDGTPYRSYQYASDLVIWLINILCFGQNVFPYNVGSDEAITIKELAYVISKIVNPELSVIIQKTAGKLSFAKRYVPSIERAQTQLGLKNSISLKEAILRTIQWYLV